MREFIFLFLKVFSFLIFALVIYKIGILDFKGTAIAMFMGVIIAVFANFNWLLLLVVFLLLGYISTKYGYSHKEYLHVAEHNSGRRGISNVLANGIVPTLFAIGYSNNFTVPSIAGYIAAVATVTGDTLSSEIGVLSKKRPVLVTSFKEVPPGTPGGVSMLGEAAGFLGTLLIGITAWMLGIASFKVSIIAAMLGGIAGFHFDSLLGAVLERRGVIGNATVNFLSATGGSLIGVAVASML